MANLILNPSEDTESKSESIPSVEKEEKAIIPSSTETSNDSTNVGAPEKEETSASAYSSEELRDPANINVVVTDKTSPLIIFFGPPACGKTMTMVRLTRYLNNMGFVVEPIRNFRPAYDQNYKHLCDGFNNLISSDDAADSTNAINFMLVRVMKNGKPICQLLEAPGEHYFDRSNPHAPFPNFVNTILSGSNRKIFAVMVEPNWLNFQDRSNYVAKIRRLKTKMRSKDKTIIVFNKIDKTHFVISPGHINNSAAQKEVKDLYPGLFSLFKNVNPITKFLREFNCQFVPFQTGDYSQSASGRQTFQEGPEEYPRILWQKIQKMIHG